MDTRWKSLVLVPIFFCLAAPTLSAAETETYTVRDTGFIRHALTNVLSKQSAVSVGYVEGGAGGIYVGYLDFLCDSPFYVAHPQAEILSIKLKIYLKTPNPQISTASYKVINLESLLNTANPETVEEIDSRHTGSDIYNAFESGETLATFADFSQVPGTLVEITLNKNLVDLTGNTKNYFLGIREDGDNDGLISFTSFDDVDKAELVISFDPDGTPTASSTTFTWSTFLPAILTGGCSANNFSACSSSTTCNSAGGAWTGTACVTCPFSGSYTGTWSEISCDQMPYHGNWTGTVDEHCYFQGYDAGDFLKGTINPVTGGGRVTGEEMDCGPLNGTIVVTAEGSISGTYSGSGVSGNYLGTRQ